MLERIVNVVRAFWKEGAYFLRKILQPHIIKNNGVRLVAKHPAISDHMRDVLYHDDYEIPEFHILRRTLNASDRVLEIGGGIGYLSTILSRHCGDENVCMVEANPHLMPLIEEIHRLNAVRPKVINRVATCSNDETTTLYLAENFWSSSTVNNTGKETVLPTVNINTLIADFRPDYLIIDIEGAETQIIPEVKFGGVRKLLLEIHPQFTGGAAANQVIRQIIDAGFVIDFFRSARNQIYCQR